MDALEGVDWQEHDTTHGIAAIVDLENPLETVHGRLHAMGVRTDDHAGLLYVHAARLDLALRLRDEGAEQPPRHALDLPQRR